MASIDKETVEERDFEAEKIETFDYLYYKCLYCGNIQSRSDSCNRCGAPVAECWCNDIMN